MHSAPSPPADTPRGAGHFPRIRLPRIVLAIDARLLFSSAAAGLLAGLIATGYYYVLFGLLRALAWLERHGPPIGPLRAGLPVWLLMPAAGLVIGLFYRLGNPGETDELVNNIHMEHGRMDLRANVPLIPISLLSIAAGGSAGPEAPMVHLTGSVGTLFHRVLALPDEMVRSLTFAGMSVGFATLFGAPVGSALFALEIPHRRGLEYYESLLPALVGCLCGYAVFAGLTHHGLGFTWTLPAYRFQSFRDLGYALLVGAICGLCAMPYVGLIRALRWVARRLTRVPRPLLGAFGGLVLGLIAWKLPATRFWGEDQLQAIAPASLALGALVLLASAKMLTVATTLASGWKGGIIIPCFLIGACLGKALARVVPGLDPTLAMVCGMAAVNIAVMKVPLGTVVVVVSMTGVNALAPVTIAALVAFVLTGGVNVIDAKTDREAAATLLAARVAANVHDAESSPDDPATTEQRSPP